MKPIVDWRHVLRHAWSVRFMLGGALLSGLEAALPFLQPFIGLPDGTFAVLSGLVVAAAIIARFVAQRDLNGGAK